LIAGVGLSESTLHELIERLQRTGYETRDAATGRVTGRTASADIAARIQDTIRDDRPFAPSKEDAELLLESLNFWLDKVTTELFPQDAMDLRYALDARRSSAD
jgi:hypothetical protein